MKWSIRYASERLGIAMMNENPNPLTEDDRSALKQFGATLNAQHINYDQAEEIKDANGIKMRSTGPKQVEEPPSDLRDSSMAWDLAVKGEMKTNLMPSAGSEGAFARVQQAIGGNNIHPAVLRAISSIRDNISSTGGTNSSNSEVGSARELHNAIINAPTENVPELHRGVLFSPDTTKALRTSTDPHQTVKDALAPGTVIPDMIRSWSADPRIARGFAHRQRITQKSTADRNVMAVFHMPAGSHALQISPFGHSSSQQEEYVAAAGHYTVKRHEVDGEGIHHIHLEQTSTDDYRPEKTTRENDIDSAHSKQEDIARRNSPEYIERMKNVRSHPMGEV